jgi:hydrogenase expression/formation protein HypC
MKILSVTDNVARVESNGIETQVSVELVPEASQGDYVIVHAGFAIQSLSEEEAKETLEIFDRLASSWRGEK